MVACLTLMLCMIHQNEAKYSTMKFKKFKCNYQCMTDFDMCSSFVTTMEMYIICFRAQGICKRQCKLKYGGRRTGRHLIAEPTTAPATVRTTRAKFNNLKKEQ